LREAALPFLQDLYNATRTTVQLGVLRDTQALVVEKITGHRALRMLSRVGGLVPAHCSALGRAILAWSPPEILERIHEAGRGARGGQCRGLVRRGTALRPLGEVVAAVSVTGPSRRRHP